MKSLQSPRDSRILFSTALNSSLSTVEVTSCTSGKTTRLMAGKKNPKAATAPFTDASPSSTKCRQKMKPMMENSASQETKWPHAVTAFCRRRCLTSAGLPRRRVAADWRLYWRLD